MKKQPDPYMPEMVSPVVDSIYCVGHDDQMPNVKNWLTKLRRLKGSILKLGEPTRKIWIIWLTRVMLGTKERLVYLVPHKVLDSQGNMTTRYNYLLIGKDGGSLHPDPIFVNTLDIRYLFKSDFDQRVSYLCDKLKLDDYDYWKKRLQEWVDTYRDGDINISSTQTVDLIEITRMLDHEKQQSYKSKKELKQEAAAAPEESSKKTKSFLFVDPDRIREMATIEQLNDCSILHNAKSYDTAFFDAGYWGDVPADQVAALNLLTNLILYPHSVKWTQMFAEVQLQKARWLGTNKGTVTGQKFLPALYSDELMRTLRNEHSQGFDPIAISMLLAKEFKSYLARNKSFLTKSNLVPVQITWSELVPGENSSNMLVDFIANDYASYARLSLAFGAGTGHITSQKALYIRNAFSVPDGKLAHVVIMNLFPSVTAIVDQSFLAMCNFGDGTVIGKVLTVEGLDEMAKVKDLDILRIKFTDIPGKALAFTRDTLINKFIEWRELCLAIAPTHDAEVHEEDYVPIKDMMKILLDDILSGTHVSTAQKAALDNLKKEIEKNRKPKQPKENKPKPAPVTPPKTPELPRTVVDNGPAEPEQPKKFGVSLADQLAGIKVEKSPTLTGEGNLTTVTKEILPDPKPTPPSPVKVAIQEKKKEEQKAKREEKKAEAPLTALDMSTWPEAEQKVAEVIYKLKSARRMEIQEELNIHPKTIMHACQALAKRGVIRMEGVTRAARWIWVGKNTQPAPEPVQTPVPQVKPEVPETTAPQSSSGIVAPPEAIGQMETEYVQRLKSFMIPLGETTQPNHVPCHLYLFGKTHDQMGEEFTVWHWIISPGDIKIDIGYDGWSYKCARDMWINNEAHWQKAFPKEVIDAINAYFRR